MIGRYLKILILIAFLAGCSSEDRTSELLLGQWEVKEAVRQHRPTSTLDGLFFEFTEDSLFTNLPVLENFPYVYENDSVTVLARDPFKLQVFYVDTTHLDLRGKINDVLFFLKFEKVKP